MIEDIQWMKALGVSALEPAILAKRSPARKRCSSLRDLTINKIINTDWPQTDKFGDTFQSLPNPLLLKILEALVAAHSDNNDPWPQSKLNLLELILKNYPELKVLKLIGAGHNSRRPRKTNQTCNKPVQMSAPSEISPSILGMKYLQVLRTMSLFDQEALKLTSLNLVKLVILEINTSVETFVHLVLLKGLDALKELHVNVHSDALHVNEPNCPCASCAPVSPRIVADTLVKLLVLLPGLTTLGCPLLLKSVYGTKFVKEYYATRGTRKRALLLDALGLLGGTDKSIAMLVSKWPGKLRARKLRLHERGSQMKFALVEAVCKILPTEQLQTLELYMFRPKVIYCALSSLAGCVAHLSINSRKPLVPTSIRHRLNLHKILGFAPRIESFKLALYSEQEEEPLERVHSQFFRNMKSFELEMMPYNQEVIQIYSSFLLGSREWDRLIILNEQQLEVVLQLLQENPKCGERTQALRIRLLEKESLETALQVASLIVMRSPWLEEVEFWQYCVRATDRVEWRRAPELKWFTDLLAATAVKLNYKHFHADCDYVYRVRNFLSINDKTDCSCSGHTYLSPV